MSSKAKKKGYRNEIWIRDAHIGNGIPAERVPGSGLFGGKYTGDVAIPAVEGAEFVVECKARAGGAGFKTLEKWMQDKQIMFLKRDRQDPMVILTWETYLKLMRFFYSAKT